MLYAARQDAMRSTHCPECGSQHVAELPADYGWARECLACDAQWGQDRHGQWNYRGDEVAELKQEEGPPTDRFVRIRDIKSDP